MTLDYFYGAQADQFAFYRIPKALFTDERFKSISAEAKILYGILLDRMSLSRKNGWLDEQGRVFIIFTLEEVMEAIGCADQKATKLLNELDSKAGLIERKRQGLGKPFPQEQELKEKSARLAQLNIELNIDDRTPMEAMAEIADSEPEVRPAVRAKSERPSVLTKLHAPLPQRDSHPKQNETEKEVR